jgi:nicotinate-nucleotide--dimethylbenzimidazole phosphoribosyltransferase
MARRVGSEMARNTVALPARRRARGLTRPSVAARATRAALAGTPLYIMFYLYVKRADFRYDSALLLDHVLSSILPASPAMAGAARDRLERNLPAGESLGRLTTVAARLAGARHTTRPNLARRTALVCAADHGVAWPGVDLGANSPAATALRLIAAGEAAVSAAARTADAHLVLVDAGVRGGEKLDLGRGVMGFRLGDGTDSIALGPAMSEETARHGVETGVALVVALGDAGLDLLALGQVAPGGEIASGALIAALTGAAPAAVASCEADAQAIAGALAANAGALAPGQPDGADPMRALAALGGLEIALQVGAILAAASVHVPVVLDDHGTWAAALIAVRLAPAAAGYLFASHGGAHPGHRAALHALALEPLFELGLAHGEGTGALLAVPLLDAASRVLAELGRA